MDIDVVVIGASSSGLFAADLLARAGRRVAVFDRQERIAPARRTYIITQQIRQLIGQLPEFPIQHKTGVMEVETANARVRLCLEKPDLIVERSLMCEYLLNRAKSAGVDLFTGYSFHDFKCKAGSTLLIFKNPQGDDFTVATNAVIGADGVYSQVARAAGINQPPSAPIVQAEVKLSVDWDSDVTKVWFDAEDTRFFYWLIPESKSQAVVGLVGDGEARTRFLLEKFMKRHGMKTLAFQGGQVALHHPRLRPWTNVGSLPVLLVGDAAGQVKVTTVGGTVTGFQGARAAVNTILHGSSYAAELRSLKRELDVHWFVHLLLERLDNPGYDRLVGHISPAIQKLLRTQNRDELVKLFWKIPFLEPHFIVFGLELLFSRAYHPSRRSPADQWPEVQL